MRDAKLATEQQRRVMNAFRRVVHADREAPEKASSTPASRATVLRVLVDLGHATLDDLSSRLLADQTAVSLALSGLTRRGLARRVQSEPALGGLAFKSGEQAPNALNEHPQTVEERLVAAVAGLSDDDLAQLAWLLERVIAGAGLGSVRPLLLPGNAGG